MCNFLTRSRGREHLFCVDAGHGRLQEDNDGDFAAWVLGFVGSVELEDWRTQVRQTVSLFLLVAIFLWLMWWKKNTYFR